MRAFMSGFVGLALITMLFACVTTPISGKKAFIAVPESQEIAMGESAYADVLKKERISTDRRLNEIVTRVGQRIAAVADKPDYKYNLKSSCFLCTCDIQYNKEQTESQCNDNIAVLGVNIHTEVCTYTKQCKSTFHTE